jgi:CDP-glycerol glycerophosphotransferase (TagB/SpsB family)
MYKIIGSADPKYLAACDLLIGDMSNINYEYLLFDRPIVLLANDWVQINYPDIGVKSNLFDLGKNIEQSLLQRNDYSEERKFWLEKSISLSPESASARYLKIILNKSKYINPKFHFIWGGNSVRLTNIEPLINEMKNHNYDFKLFKGRKDYVETLNRNVIIVAAHFKDIWEDVPGFKVHIDHDLKSIATANLEYAESDYKKNNYFPHIDLHITTGVAGNKRTMHVLGPNSNRTIIGGYPKADTLMSLGVAKTKLEVCAELQISPELPLICYAPAGKESIMKPGGSLSNRVLKELRMLASAGEYNVLVKTKYGNNLKWFKNGLKNVIRYNSINPDDGVKWRKIRDDIIWSN